MSPFGVQGGRRGTSDLVSILPRPGGQCGGLHVRGRSFKRGPQSQSQPYATPGKPWAENAMHCIKNDFDGGESSGCFCKTLLISEPS